MRLTPRKLNIVIAVVAFTVLPPLMGRNLPSVFTNSRMLIFGIGVCYAAAAVSLNLLMGYAGQISLGHGAILAVGAFASGLLTTRGFHAPILVGLLFAAVMGGGVAFLVGLPALRLRGLYLAIATIAFSFMMEESFFKWEVISRGSSGIEMPKRLLGHIELVRYGDYLPVALLALLLIWLIDHNVVRTRLGRAFHGVRENEDVAQSFGIDVARYKLLAFVISGVLAGFSGAVYGHLIGIVNSQSFSYEGWSLLLVIVVVVGGLGDRRGVVIAALFFAFFPHLLDSLRGWDLIVGAALLIYTISNHPGGFAEVMREARDKRRARLETEADDEDAVPSLPRLPLPAGVQRADTKTGALLDVRGVKVAYGGLVAVDGASLKVERGQIVGLIGPNGAGKTSLFNAISGFVKQQQGEIVLGGTHIEDLSPHERAHLGIGRTFQLIGLAKNLSVLENFMLAQHPFADYPTMSALMFTGSVAVKEDELLSRSHSAIAALGFSRYTDAAVKNLSHGQQRLVELGCALMTAPDLLLLDEPSAGFSPAAVENLAARLKEIRDHLGRTVLLIEHNIPLVLDLCDYIYVLNFGKILAHGSPEEIAADPQVIAAYFGHSPAEVKV